MIPPLFFKPNIKFLFPLIQSTLNKISKNNLTHLKIICKKPTSATTMEIIPQHRKCDLTVTSDFLDEVHEERRTTMLRMRNLTETLKRKGTGLNSIDVRNLKGNVYVPQASDGTAQSSEEEGFYGLTEEEQELVEGI
jgi:hypothetical protein